MQEDHLAQQAIQAAISGNWQQAVNLNKRIITQNPEDLETILRLANAFAQLGKVKDALTHYDLALKIDPHNVFAKRGQEKLKKFKKNNSAQIHKLANSFLEEPGKTKAITLVYPAQPSVLAQLDSGQPLVLDPKLHRVSVTTQDDTYIGRLPDDLAIRLLGFIKGGNKYEAVVKAVENDQVKIFIRETYRCERFTNIPSFTPDTNHIFEEEE